MTEKTQEAPAVEKVMALVDDYAEAYFFVDGTEHDIKDDLKAAVEALAQPGSAWISVEERMPEPGQTVLGFYPGTSRGGWNFATVTYLAEGVFDDWTNPEDGADAFVAPTHWMPLPAAPTGAQP